MTNSSLEFQVRVGGTLPKLIDTDQQRLCQILNNLTSNAIKFTRKGAVVLCAEYLYENETHEIKFTVIDSGIGISSERLEYLFDRFHQGDGGIHWQSSGLGLSICKGLVDKLGGAITAASELGKGSTFVVRLRIDPALAAEQQSLDEYRAANAINTPTATPTPDTEINTEEDEGTVDRAEDCEPAQNAVQQDTVQTEFAVQTTVKRILYVEDGQDNQRLVRHILVKSGYDVVIANDGLEAIEELERARREDEVFYCLVLMDMQMPRMDGYDASRRLREKGFHIPIIALTAHAMIDDRRKCLDAGCTEYLAKPIKPAVLREKILEVLAVVSQTVSGE